MTRQVISTGTTANDGTGDTLRSAGTKINDNFEEIYQSLGDGSNLSLSDELTTDKIIHPANTITANGATNADYTYNICNKATALAVSLADGTTVGETKIFTNKGAGTATITPANLAGTATAILIEQYESVTLIWDGTNWYITGGYGQSVS